MAFLGALIFAGLTGVFCWTSNRSSSYGKERNRNAELYLAGVIDEEEYNQLNYEASVRYNRMQH